MRKTLSAVLLTSVLIFSARSFANGYVCDIRESYNDPFASSQLVIEISPHSITKVTQWSGNMEDKMALRNNHIVGMLNVDPANCTEKNQKNRLSWYYEINCSVKNAYHDIKNVADKLYIDDANRSGYYKFTWVDSIKETESSYELVNCIAN